MKAVYISSPYTIGNKRENVGRQFAVAEKLVDLGFLPYPPLYTHFWEIISSHSKDYWMKLDFEWILRCDYVLRLSGESYGSDAEVEFAKDNGIPVFYSLEELSAVLERGTHDIHTTV